MYASSSVNLRARLQEIESKIAFQGWMLEALNDALTGQQKQLDALNRQSPA